MTTIRQMRAPDALVIVQMVYDDVEHGWMKYGPEGKIFLLLTYGHYTVHRPVFEDGSVSPIFGFDIFPYGEVDLIDPRALGITELRWTDPKEKPT